jgi:flagellar FliL protein
MSAAAATTAAPGAAPAKGGKKKLIVIVALALVLLLAIGGGALFFLKSKAAHAKADAEDAGATTAESAEGTEKVDLKHPPAFMPLDPFVVNLADRDADRYAQVGITLEVDSPEFAEELKTYMPAVRNAILMILAHKTSAQLLDREGKEALAAEIMREAVRPMGIDIDPPSVAAKDGAKDDAKPAASDDDGADAKPKSRGKSKKAAVHNPVRHVLFSNFIIQ